MAVEIEKKYRLSGEQRARVLQKLREVGARLEAEDFETNTLFTGGILSSKPAAVLRLRTTQSKAVLTYKESLAIDSEIKRRLEHETVVSDGKAMNDVLLSLGYKPSLIYEKRRQTWQFGAVEIAVDELPFGFYLEIEGAEDEILNAESKLELNDLIAENEPYPGLTKRFGEQNADLIEARFK